MFRSAAKQVQKGLFKDAPPRPREHARGREYICTVHTWPVSQRRPHVLNG